MHEKPASNSAILGWDSCYAFRLEARKYGYQWLHFHHRKTRTWQNIVNSIDQNGINCANKSIHRGCSHSQSLIKGSSRSRRLHDSSDNQAWQVNSTLSCLCNRWFRVMPNTRPRKTSGPLHIVLNYRIPRLCNPIVGTSNSTDKFGHWIESGIASLR